MTVGRGGAAGAAGGRHRPRRRGAGAGHGRAGADRRHRPAAGRRGQPPGGDRVTPGCGPARSWPRTCSAHGEPGDQRPHHPLIRHAPVAPLPPELLSELDPGSSPEVLRGPSPGARLRPGPGSPAKQPIARGRCPLSACKQVAVFGATGFVGAAVVRALNHRGVIVLPMTTPRLPPIRADQAEKVLQNFSDDIVSLAERLRRTDCVINSAGIAEAASTDEGSLIAANGLVPGYLARAALSAGVPRFVQVSSAAVQGRVNVLDSSPAVAAFSPYSRSKVLGALLARNAHPGTVEYRPPGVHGADRRISQMSARIARSRLSSVAQPGSSPSPQALLSNVADAIAYLATSQDPAATDHRHTRPKA